MLFTALLDVGSRSRIGEDKNGVHQTCKKKLLQFDGHNQVVD